MLRSKSQNRMNETEQTKSKLSEKSRIDHSHIHIHTHTISGRLESERESETHAHKKPERYEPHIRVVSRLVHVHIHTAPHTDTHIHAPNVGTMISFQRALPFANVYDFFYLSRSLPLALSLSHSLEVYSSKFRVCTNM